MTTRISVFAWCLMALSAVAAAQNASPRVAICNPARIFNEIQETKDHIAKMENDRRVLQQTAEEKRLKIRDAQNLRDQLRSDSPQYAERNNELMALQIEAQTWSQLQELNLQREQKLKMRELFDKITLAVQEVATQRGIDLVIAEVRPIWPDNIDQLNPDQVRILINQRNVLFSVPNVDVSDEVIAAMDAKYKAGR